MADHRPKAQHAAPAGLRWTCRTLSAVAPPLAVRLAAELFCRPRPRRPRRGERERLERARREGFTIRGHRLDLYRWGEGPRVLLHHGWSGDAAQMSAFVDPLVGAGFEVIAVDGLGHGASEGRVSSFVDMAIDAISLNDHVGGLHAVIGHSMGAMIAARILRARDVDRAILLAPPAEMRVYSELFAHALDLSDAVHDAMVARFERSHFITWDDITAERLAEGRHEDVLIVYDDADQDAPPEHARRWIDRWSGTVETMRTEGLGHRQILRDPAVHERCVAWLNARRSA